jgi:uncharacterized membrane protein
LADSSKSSGRVDAFVDAAFAFAMTLLVVSADSLPTTLQDLMTAAARIPAFAGGFALMALFWWSHYSFRQLHRRDDGPSLLLSLAIVFVVMIYVYPLRLLTESAVFYISGGVLPGSPLVRSAADMRLLYVVYGLGFIVLAGLYWLLFRHAAGCAESSAIEESARDAANRWLVVAAVGMLSLALAVLMPPTRSWLEGLPGMVYALIPVLMPLWLHLCKPKPVRASAG